MKSYMNNSDSLSHIEPINFGTCMLLHDFLKARRANIVIAFVLPHVVATLELDLFTSL